MAVIEKNLGPVSAYAVAVANGYEGTEEQWAAEIAAASQNAQAAAGSATEAAGSAAAAAQSVTEANNAKTAAQQAAESAAAAYGTDLLATTFSADTAYTSGQYVIYNGGLYVFTADHPAGAWIDTDARRVQVGGELTNLKSANKNIADTLYPGGMHKTPSEYPFQLGGLTGGGSKTDSSNRIRSAQYYVVTPGAVVVISPKEGLAYRVAYYTPTLFDHFDEWQFGTPTVIPYVEGQRFKILARYIDSAEVTDVSDAAALIDVSEYIPVEGLITYESAVSFASEDFISGIVINTITGVTTKNTNFSVLSKNLIDFLPIGACSVKLTPAEGKRCVVTGFSEKPNYDVDSDNLSIIVDNKSGEVDETIEIALKDGLYYIIQTTDINFTLTASVLRGVEEKVQNVIYDATHKLVPLDIEMISGTFWNVESSVAVLGAHDTWKSAEPISVKAGDTYVVTGVQGGSNKVRIWTVTDDDFNILDKADNYYGLVSHENIVHVPEGGTKLLISNRVSYNNSVQALVDAFEFSERQTAKLLEGKTIAILGDSISTNGTSIQNPYHNAREIIIHEEDVGVQLSAYLTYFDVRDSQLSLGGYTYTNSEVGTEVTFTPLAEDVGKTIGRSANYNDDSVKVWWEVMQDALGNDTIPVCWSGSSITDHEKNTLSRATSWAFHPAQIRKCGKRIPGTMDRIAPDMIIIYRGTNDFSHEPYTLLTDNYFENYNWQYPTTDEVTGGYGFLEGISITVQKLREAYPNAQIYLCTLNVFKRINYDHFPTNNGINSLPQYNEAIRKAANFFGCGLIEFDKDGITFENCYAEGYITDSQEHPTHPTNKGHRAMGLKAIADITAQYNKLS